MDIKHRINFNADNIGVYSKLVDMGIDAKLVELPGDGGNLITILINESDPHWDEVVKLVNRIKHFVIYGDGDQYETIFSDDEIRNAKWLRLISTFEQGYPQPKSNWPVKQFSYENVCPKCGIYQQTRGMRLAKEPSLRNKSFMSLIWTGEIFCTPEVIRALEEIHAAGYEVWNAIIHKTDEPSRIVHQLYIPGITSPGVIADKESKYTICPVCSKKKYSPHLKGIMELEEEALIPDSDFMLTNEWFGNGLIAWREILVSNRVAQLILDQGWQGVRFKVVKVV